MFLYLFMYQYNPHNTPPTFCLFTSRPILSDSSLSCILQISSSVKKYPTILIRTLCNVGINTLLNQQFQETCPSMYQSSYKDIQRSIDAIRQLLAGLFSNPQKKRQERKTISRSLQREMRIKLHIEYIPDKVCIHMWWSQLALFIGIAGRSIAIKFQ